MTYHGFATRAVHDGSEADPTTGAVIPAISLSSTFAQRSAAQPLGLYEYSRSANPNRDNFETAIVSLEEAKFALAYSSGSATTSNILQALATNGSHLVSISDVYGGTHRYFTKVASSHGVQVTFVKDIESELGSAITAQTRLVWVESPTNPTLRISDLEKVARIVSHVRDSRGTAQKDDQANSIYLVVDNTFLSPYIQTPLTKGADIVVHSVTKYLNGHSDVVMGVAATNNALVHDKLRFLQNAMGAVPSAFDSWLAHRGLKTLHLRVKQASLNALAVAQALQDDPRVLSVTYPGLASHPQHSVVLRQHRDGLGGGMVSLRVKGGAEAANKFCQRLKVFTLAESLGGIESLCEIPAVMTHAGIPRTERELSGVFDNLVRLSVGIEDEKDLVADVLQALDN